MSTDRQYTPGPWRIKRNPVTVQILASNGDYIAENVRSLPNQEANARLIAAVPDLYEALKAYHAANRLHHDEDARLFALSEAAIAKAEGGPR